MNKILFKGTLILTLTGFATRVIGFFYRIFLSRAFGAEGMGIYQLVSPVLALSFSICCGGIQSAISKYVAGEPTSHDYRHSFRVLFIGLALSGGLSMLFSGIVILNAPFIAARLLCEPRTEPLLRIIAVSIPFASMHSCINGYYYGIKNTKIPAISQIIEQIIRVGTVFLLYRYSLSHQMQLSLSCSVFGMLAGEICSALLTGTLVMLRFGCRIGHPASSFQALSNMRKSPAIHKILSRIIRMALPLSASRVVVNLLSGVESVYIPLMLVKSGLPDTQALSVYGVFTGMALPFILFPSTLTNSFSVLLLPLISEAQERVDYGTIRRAFRRTASCSIAFGVLCCILFLLTGRFAGTFFFHNELAGRFILTLSFICPFLYLSTTMSSILHGLGHTGCSFIINTTALCIRLAFVFFLVPLHGIEACLWGLLASQLFCACANSLTILHYTEKG
ncbi:MAG: polysaccharide biosynthesis protein [bacterium]|nr:polysaccharide biosynthesis protein [bacterium]